MQGNTVPTDFVTGSCQVLDGDDDDDDDTGVTTCTQGEPGVSLGSWIAETEYQNSFCSTDNAAGVVSRAYLATGNCFNIGPASSSMFNTAPGYNFYSCLNCECQAIPYPIDTACTVDTDDDDAFYSSFESATDDGMFVSDTILSTGGFTMWSSSSGTSDRINFGFSIVLLMGTLFVFV
jgi:hypothetical protein